MQIKKKMPLVPLPLPELVLLSYSWNSADSPSASCLQGTVGTIKAQWVSARESFLKYTLGPSPTDSGLPVCMCTGGGGRGSKVYFFSSRKYIF